MAGNRPGAYSVHMMGMSSFCPRVHVVVDVLLGERVLVPVVAEFLDGAADAQRVGILVGPHRVEHEREVVADRLAHRAADLHVGGRLTVRMNLVRRPARILETQRLLDVLGRRLVEGGAGVGGDRVLAGAEQPVNGLAGDLAVDVPQADVDRADRLDRRLAVQLPEPLPQPPDVLRVLAHDDRFEVVDERAGQVMPAEVGAAQKRVAGDAGVGLHAHHAELRGAAERGAAGRPHLAVPREQIDLDVGNTHGPAAYHGAHRRPRHGQR